MKAQIRHRCDAAASRASVDNRIRPEATAGHDHGPGCVTQGADAAVSSTAVLAIDGRMISVASEQITLAFAKVAMLGPRGVH